MRIYLRPAARRRRRLRSGRAVAQTGQFHQHRQVDPAITSTLALSMIEIAKLDGAPPNMSVRTITPRPASTACTPARMSRAWFPYRHQRQCTRSHLKGPTTCSNAARKAAANCPWVTRTRPMAGPSSSAIFIPWLFPPARPRAVGNRRHRRFGKFWMRTVTGNPRVINHFATVSATKTER